MASCGFAAGTTRHPGHPAASWPPGDGFDGAVQGSVVATYLHGPCLARNPQLADHLLSRVVGDLPPLDLPEVDQLRRERLAAPRRV